MAGLGTKPPARTLALSGAAAPPDLERHLKQLEARALALERLLAGQVEWAQLETVQHLQLLDAAVDSMTVSTALDRPLCITDFCVQVPLPVQGALWGVPGQGSGCQGR